MIKRLRNQLTEERKYFEDTYKREISSLINELQIELSRIEFANRNNRVYEPNSFGVVQGQGKRIDDLAYRISICNRLLEAVRKSR